MEGIELEGVGSDELGGDAAPIATADDGDPGHLSVSYSGGGGGGGVIGDGVLEGRSHGGEWGGEGKGMDERENRRGEREELNGIGAEKTDTLSSVSMCVVLNLAIYSI